jgi:5-methylcytosine-specific restriction endonuclease McrA
MPRRGSRSTTARGLGWDHQKIRRRLLARHVDGTPCEWCGEPMWKGTQELDADHTVSRSQGGRRADRLLHALCNRSRGDGTRDADRAPTAATVTDGWADRQQWCVLNWT